MFYVSSAVYPSVPADPCVSGNLVTQVTATGTGGDVLTETISGLSARNTYRVCVKARDLASNISSTAVSMSVTTQDKTAPTPFDGVQSITFDSDTGNLVVGWNTSTASDTRTYIVSLYKNTATPTGGQISSFTRSHSSYPSSATFSPAEFAFSDGERVYAYVNVCDTAGDMPAGSDNCTSLGTASSVNVLLPDISPPSGFNGIASSAQLEVPAQGQVLVKWTTPASWGTDYRGFRVYTLDGSNNLTLVKDCECASGGSNATCDSPPYTQCVVTGLDARRTYKFHVRAYDGASPPNVTQNDPATSFASKTTTDTTAPTWASSNLAVGATPTYPLSWGAASDNQYASEAGATLTYKVYRKAGSAFADATQPQVDGVLRATTTSLAFTEAGGQFTEGENYQYTVCVTDTSNNTKCPGQTQSFTVPDFTKPTITNLDTDWARYKKKWTLTWNMSDNSTASNALFVRIYQNDSSSPLTLATKADPVVFSGTGSTSAILEGPAGVDRYVHYLLEVIDVQGNASYSRLSVRSDNRISITKVRTAHGSVAGGSFVVVHGSGFSKGARNGFATDTKVFFGTNECVNTRYIVPGVMACETPAAAGAGEVSVTVENPDGSSATLANAFNYTNSAVDICDANPTTWGTDFASGAGTVGSPYVICTSTHLQNMNSTTPINYMTGGKYFVLKRNIDMQGVTHVPIGSATGSGGGFAGFFEGDGHVIRRISYTTSTSSSRGIGLFSGSADWAAASLSNFGVIDSTITGTGVSNVGLIAGVWRNNLTGTVSDLFAEGSVSGVHYVGGLFAILGNPYPVRNLSSNTVLTVGGGISGGIHGGYQQADIMENWHWEGSISGNLEQSGGLVGRSGGALSGCSVIGTLGGTPVGGLGGVVGSAVGTLSISNCLVDITINGNNNSGFGGLVGSAAPDTTISDSVVTGTIGASVGNCIGGAIGDAGANVNVTTLSITDVHVSGEMSGSGANRKGGLVGTLTLNGSSASAVTIENSSFAGTLGINGNSSNNYAGLVGSINNTSSAGRDLRISNSFVDAQVGTGITYGYAFGGIVGTSTVTGLNSVTLSNVFALPRLAANYQVGGVFGATSGPNHVIQNTIIAEPTFSFTDQATTSRLVGSKASGSAISLSGLVVGTEDSAVTQNFGTSTDAITGTVTQKVRAEIQDSTSNLLEGLGYDFDETTGTWAWDPLVPGYPYLRENPPWVRR